MIDWLWDRRWSVVIWVAFYFSARLLVDVWHELGFWSFCILAAAVLFDLGVMVLMFWSFQIYRDDPIQQDLEIRRAENRLPKKRFGNAPRSP